MRRAIALTIMASVAACSPPMERTAEQGSARQASLLGPEERRTARLSARWLVGYWDHRKGCPPDDAGTSLRPDGTYGMADGRGRWSLSGDILTVTEERPPSLQIFQARLGDAGRSRLKILGPDSLSVHWIDGGEAAFYRCDPLPPPGGKT